MDIKKLFEDSENELKDVFKQIDKQVFKNSCKVLDAFHHNELSESSFGDIQLQWESI